MIPAGLLTTGMRSTDEIIVVPHDARRGRLDFGSNPSYCTLHSVS